MTPEVSTALVIWLQPTLNGGRICFMGNPIQSTTPDLLSTAANGEDVSATPLSSSTTAETPRYFLPKDLPQAVKALSDQELDQLSAAVLVEQQRHGKGPIK